MSIARSTAVLAAIGVMAIGGVTVAQSPAPPEGTPWVLQELVVGGELTDVPDDVMVTLLMEDGQASGNAGCNTYSGSYTLRLETLIFEPISSTAMLCAETPGSTETAYLADLARVATFALDRQGLTMLDAGGDVLLVYDGAESPTITGGWVVTGYRTSGRDLAPPTAGSLLTSVFGPDGTLEGSSGCNHFTAPYTVDGGDITIGNLSSTRIACASPELQTQETEFLAALAASTKWSQDGTDLELVDASGVVGKDTTVSLTAETVASYLGSWTVTGYDRGNGSVVAPVTGSTPTAVFGIDGTLVGDSGCNSYSGPYTVSGWAMTIGPLATSRMACSDVLGAQEQQYIAALEAVTSWATDGDGIVLRGGDGATKVTLAPTP